MKNIRFGIIGCGLMGREFASAAARWCHLTGANARPEIVAVCDVDSAATGWFTAHFDSVRQVTGDYRTLLANPAVDAVYCAVPHHLHREVYCEAIRSGKHLLGEKPFGIDQPANAAILACLREHPALLARCSSEFPFFPAVQRIGRSIGSGELGRIIEVNAGFQHSSDLDAEKPIHWKRMVEYNGEYGCLGDLGMHVCHVPFRAGWTPRNVRAIFSKIVSHRPDGRGKRVPCTTWDNATLLCSAANDDGDVFPLTLKTQRVAPGEKNTWYIEILATKRSLRFSTKNPKRLAVLDYSGGEQVWGQIDVGYEPALPCITGGIFEFGFSDAVLQMWAAFLFELECGRMVSRFAGCATPEEMALSHRLFTAALQSHATHSVVAL